MCGRGALLNAIAGTCASHRGTRTVMLAQDDAADGEPRGLVLRILRRRERASGVRKMQEEVRYRYSRHAVHCVRNGGTRSRVCW
jgi:hypothetical protein